MHISKVIIAGELEGREGEGEGPKLSSYLEHLRRLVNLRSCTSEISELFLAQVKRVSQDARVGWRVAAEGEESSVH